MQVEQAVYTSARSRKSQGYHVVAVSPGISDVMTRQLAVWGPSHASLLSEQPDAESLNFHALNDDFMAISRTVHGGAEYSGRAGLQVFTRFLLLRHAQFAAYEYNALDLAQTATALGALRLLLDLPSRLPRLELPDRTLANVAPLPGVCPVSLDSIRRSMALGSRVAVIGLDDPLPVLSSLLEEVPARDRAELSFCTGLKPSIERSFRLQFAQRPDSNTLKQLAKQGIDQVTASL